jgi:hypothetical protein
MTAVYMITETCIIFSDLSGHGVARDAHSSVLKHDPQGGIVALVIGALVAHGELLRVGVDILHLAVP